MIGELQRLKLRMKVHPWRVLLLAGAMTALVVARYATKPRFHTARVILRATQGSLNDERGSPLPSQELRDHVYSYILNKKVVVEEVIKKHGFELDTLRKFGEEAAIEEVKEPLSVDVVRNYFLHSRRYESTPRSLRLVISYTWTDPEFAYKMASLFADLVVENVQSQRLAQARFGARNAREALARMEAEVAAQKQRLNELMFELTTAEITQDAEARVAARVALTELNEELRNDEFQLSALRHEQREIEFRLRMEERNLGLVWEVAGEVRPRAIRPPGPIRLSALALFCFCIFVPLCAIGFGAFDSKIYDLDDAGRLGLPVVGHIPSFHGDGAGSLRARGALQRSRLKRGGWVKNRRRRFDRVA